jgi:hypothetical protein
MKARIIIAIAVPVLFLLSCNEIDKLLTFSIYNNGTFRVQSGFPINSPIEVPTPDVTTNSTVMFSANNTRADLVKDVRLQEMRLTIASPSDRTFSFLKSIRIFISTNNTNEIELAYKTDINSTSKSLNLTCTAQKLDSYIRSSSYKLRTEMVTKETITQDIDVNFAMRFSVVADPL